MSALPSPVSSESTPLTDEITLAKTLKCLLENLPLEMRGSYERQQLFEGLLTAASERRVLTIRQVTSPTLNHLRALLGWV